MHRSFVRSFETVGTNASGFNTGTELMNLSGPPEAQLALCKKISPGKVLPHILLHTSFFTSNFSRKDSSFHLPYHLEGRRT